MLHSHRLLHMVRSWSLSRSWKSFASLSQACDPISKGTSGRFQDAKNETESRLQPWRAVWPLTGTDLVDVWSKAEFPEVVSWRFDPRSPFDRPWRTWTRSTLARSEKSPDGWGERSWEEEEYAFRSDGTQVASARYLDIEIQSRDIGISEPMVFSYLAPLKKYNTEKPYLSRLPFLPGFARTNIVGRRRTIPIHEVSSNEDIFTLDRSGFEFAKFAFVIDKWSDVTIGATYLPALHRWLKTHLSCSEIHVYAYNFRGTQQKKFGEPWKAPFFRAHCDATAASCSKRLKLYLPGRKRALRGRRVRFLNIWRPITFPLQTSPLALCDARTVSQEDLIAADIVFPHYLDEAYELLYNPDHRWFYKQEMKRDDVIIFKLADNAKGVASLCPHSAFKDPSVPEGTPERASVEVRVIVVD